MSELVVDSVEEPPELLEVDVEVLVEGGLKVSVTPSVVVVIGVVIDVGTEIVFVPKMMVPDCEIKV